MNQQAMEIYPQQCIYNRSKTHFRRVPFGMEDGSSVSPSLNCCDIGEHVRNSVDKNDLNFIKLL